MRKGSAKHRKKLQQLLRSIRQDAGIRQADLAKKLGKPQSFVSKYESGEKTLDLFEAKEICDALRIPFAEFIKRFEEIFS